MGYDGWELIETGKSALLNAPTNPRVAVFVQGLINDIYSLIVNPNLCLYSSHII